MLTLMPGPDNIFVLTESLTKGRRNGLAISTGLSLGVLVHTIAAATGLSLIIQSSALAFSIIKYAGALYLLYLAYKAFREKQPVSDFEAGSAPPSRFLVLVRKGFLMNILNPKVSLFFIAFLPQFISPNGMDITFQMIILGVIFMVQAWIIFSAIALLSGKLTRYVNSPRFWNITRWGKVTVLSLLALTLAISKK